MTIRLSTGARNALLGNQSLYAIFNMGILQIYSGVQPNSADIDETAYTLLVSLRSQNYEYLHFDTPVNGTMFKAASEIWTGAMNAANTFTAGANNMTANAWWRFYDKNVVMGFSSTACRIDGTCGGNQIIFQPGAYRIGDIFRVDHFGLSILPTPSFIFSE